jgi:F0F1-type ATP synthase membrane subunit b/b'
MIHSTVLATVVAGPEILIVAGWVILLIAVICFIVRVGLHILKTPTEKNLQARTDSITNECQKIHAALEELTKAVRESKEK